jgi:hypothetical protein
VIVVIIVAVVVVLSVVAVLVRRRRRSRPSLAPAARAAMPEVLVAGVIARPSIEDETLALATRLGSSRRIFDRVRSIANVGPLSPEQLDVVEEVLLRSDVGLATTTALPKVSPVRCGPRCSTRWTRSAPSPPRPSPGASRCGSSSA